MEFVFDTVIPRSVDTTLLLNKENKIDIMKDGTVIYWERNGDLSLDWNKGLIYESKEDYNENHWVYHGEIDYKTKKPCGFGLEYNKEKETIEKVYYWPSGNKYIGQWTDGKMEGEGTMIYANGDIYEGLWENGEFGGFGNFDCIDYDYIGQFKNGMRHGLGLNNCHHDGSTYEGEWANDEMVGHGRYVCDLYTYVGFFYSSDANGYGTQTWNDGAIYEGYWVNGLMNGEGKYTCKNYTYVGEFVDDLCEGLGKITWSNGNSYEGKFIDDIIDLYYDEGVFTFADGSKYIGRLNKIWDVLVNSDDHKV